MNLRALSRLPDWDQRLNAMLTASRDRAYSYGHWDCLVGLSAAAVKALLGKDPGRGHRGKYRSIASASRYLCSLGHDNPRAMLDSLFDDKPIGFAQRGDLVLVPGDAPGAWDIPAVCIGADALCIPLEQAGLLRVPRDQWLKAWAVGDHHSEWPE